MGRNRAETRAGHFQYLVFGRFTYTLSALVGLADFWGDQAVPGWPFLTQVRQYQTACA